MKKYVYSSNVPLRKVRKRNDNHFRHDLSLICFLFNVVVGSFFLSDLHFFIIVSLGFIKLLAVLMLQDAYQQICESTKASTQPSFLLRIFDEAMRLASAGHVSGGGGGVDSNYALKEMNDKTEDNPQDAVLSKPSKNGTKMLNGVYHDGIELVTALTVKDKLHNGHSSQHQHDDAGLIHGIVEIRRTHQHYNLSEVSQVLTDTATNVVTAILDIRKSSNSSSFTAIRNDARILLRRLIRSGKVLARNHLNCLPMSLMKNEDDHKVYGSSSFLNLLQSLELSSAEIAMAPVVWSAYTPFDLLCDIFQFCPDVSERQIVIAIRHTLFNTRPEDVASFFVRNKSIPENHILRKRSMYLMKKMNPKNMSKGRNSIETEQCLGLQYKVLVSGTAFLMDRIMKYSLCNVALLRDAFDKEFHHCAEIQLLLRLVVEILSNSENLMGVIVPSSPTTPMGGMKNWLQYVAILCDCLRNNMCLDDDDDDSDSHKSNVATMKETLERVQNVVQSMTLTTGSILSLQNVLQESLEQFRMNEAHGSSNTSNRLGTSPTKNDATTYDPTIVSPRKTHTSLPPYQIERLLF
jgi:hypothetical protein